MPGTLISTVGALFNHYFHLVVRMHTLWLREVAIWPVVTQLPRVTEMNQGTRERPLEKEFWIPTMSQVGHDLSLVFLTSPHSPPGLQTCHDEPPLRCSWRHPARYSVDQNLDSLLPLHQGGDRVIALLKVHMLNNS